MSKSLLIALLLAILPATAWAQVSESVNLNIGEHEISAELALTPTEQAQGLMFRDYLAENSGMLFVYEAEHEVCMWMKNTVIPLEVAFLNKAGMIINLAQMKPLRKATHCSMEAATYALEMNADWFSSRDIKSGDQVLGLPSADQ